MAHRDGRKRIPLGKFFALGISPRYFVSKPSGYTSTDEAIDNVEHIVMGDQGYGGASLLDSDAYYINVYSMLHLTAGVSFGI